MAACRTCSIKGPGRRGQGWPGSGCSPAEAAPPALLGLLLLGLPFPQGVEGVEGVVVIPGVAPFLLTISGSAWAAERFLVRSSTDATAEARWRVS